MKFLLNKIFGRNESGDENKEGKETFEVVNYWNQWFPVSTLEQPVWYLDTTGSLNWLFRYPEDGRFADEAVGTLVWFNIAERNSYCDRGHYRVSMVEGTHALHIDPQDEREGMYYMGLLHAIEETRAWALWRILERRYEPYPQLRTNDVLRWDLKDPQNKGLLHGISWRCLNPSDINSDEIVQVEPQQVPA